MNNKELGQIGENIAIDYLLKQGLQLKEQNFRCPLGEIDIILTDKKTLVFCEVKTRADLEFGNPIDFITKHKLSRIERVGTYYMMMNNIAQWECRIDAVGIHFENHLPKIRWIKNCTF